MHELAFADAARPTQVVCLRLPLRPYSLGHEILLLQQRNPILLLSRAQFNELSFEHQRQALLRATLICSNTWAQNKKRPRWLKLWVWTLRRTNWPLAIADFRNYLGSSRAAFPGPHPEADLRCAKAMGYTPLRNNTGRSAGAPLLARLINFVAARPPDPDLDSPIHDFPFALANLLYETELEAHGAARFENVDELDEKNDWLEMEREREERLKAEEAAGTAPASSAGLATTPPDLNDASETSESGKGGA
jgi:hypothetical protein